MSFGLDCYDRVSVGSLSKYYPVVEATQGLPQTQGLILSTELSVS